MAATWWSVALVLGGCGGAGAAVPAVGNAPPATSFELAGTTWILDGVVGERGAYGNVKDDSGRTFWVTRYDDGAGPIDLATARALMREGATSPVELYAREGEAARYELVMTGLAISAGTLGERLIDDPRGDGSTVSCSFELTAGASAEAWRAALDVCRSLHPAAP